MSRVAVFGGTGFVGSAVVRHLRERGDVVSVLPAPRLRSAAGNPAELLAEAARPATGVARDLGGYDAVVNAAGVAQAPSDDRDLLVGANALLPTVVAQAAREAGVPRFVHLSSAAVQGRAPRLDEQPTHAADSEYSRSKALGEAALRATGWDGCVVLRPTSVHGPDRRVTHRLAGPRPAAAEPRRGAGEPAQPPGARRQRGPRGGGARRPGRGAAAQRAATE